MSTDLLVVAALCGLAPLTVAVALARRLHVPLTVVAIAAACYLLNVVLQQPIFLGLRPHVGGLGPLLLVAHVVFDASVFGLQVLLDPTSLWPTVLFGALAAVAVVVTVALRRSWAGDICAYRPAAADVRIAP